MVDHVEDGFGEGESPAWLKWMTSAHPVLARSRGRAASSVPSSTRVLLDGSKTSTGSATSSSSSLLDLDEPEAILADAACRVLVRRPAGRPGQLICVATFTVSAEVVALVEQERAGIPCSTWAGGRPSGTVPSTMASEVLIASPGSRKWRHASSPRSSTRSSAVLGRDFADQAAPSRATPRRRPRRPTTLQPRGAQTAKADALPAAAERGYPRWHPRSAVSRWPSWCSATKHSRTTLEQRSEQYLFLSRARLAARPCDRWPRTPRCRACRAVVLPFHRGVEVVVRDRADPRAPLPDTRTSSRTRALFIPAPSTYRKHPEHLAALGARVRPATVDGGRRQRRCGRASRPAGRSGPRPRRGLLGARVPLPALSRHPIRRPRCQRAGERLGRNARASSSATMARA